MSGLTLHSATITAVPALLNTPPDCLEDVVTSLHPRPDSAPDPLRDAATALSGLRARPALEGET
jgi:hypothetical protein